MILNVNFGNEDSALPSDGFILDFGEGFSEDRGFGWVTEDSLNNTVATPIDLTTNTRDRELNNNQSLDTLIHLQYPEGLTGARAEASITTSSAWEYILADGQYTVTVSVGDPEFTDSNHVINIEGQTIISDFTPSGEQLFTEATTVVEVTDGKLTIDAIGGENTKLNFLEIVSENGEDEDVSDPSQADASDNSGVPEDASDDDKGNDNNIPEDTVDDSLSDDVVTEENTANDAVEENFVPDDSIDDTITGDSGVEDVADSGVNDAPEDDVSDDSDVSEDDSDADFGNDGISPEDNADDGITDDPGVIEDGLDEEVVAENGVSDDGADDGIADDTDESVSDDIGVEDSASNDPGVIKDGLDEGVIAEDAEFPEDTEDVGSSDVSDTLDEPISINFGTPTVSSEADIQDIGTEFSEEQGFGWVTQDSIGSDNPIPLGIQGNTRDRNSIEPGTLDSLIHLQFPEELTQPGSVSTPAAWEYLLADGQYTVTVAVGDPDFTDSNHVINIEGNNVISSFIPTEEQLFETTTNVVEVTDGRLTIDAIGGENTKLNFVEIAPADDAELIEDTPLEITPIEVPTDVGIPIEGGGVVETVQAVANGINVNFGVPAFDTPTGFIQDFGQAYSADKGFGWVTQESAGSNELVPLNLIPNGRDRNTLFNDGQGGLFPEPVKDSLVHMQYPTGLPKSDVSETTPAAWEYDIANGQYEVTVGVGDSDFFDSTHVINVEGENLISEFTPIGSVENGFLPIGAQAFSTGSAIVEVDDGKLTVEAIGGENTKINFISFVPVDTL
ncbi:MAG: hypothetical protein AAGF83_03770 [Cyanobacteria bacterium P01_G01_bin.67]